MKKLFIIMGLLSIGSIYSSVEQSVSDGFTNKLQSKIKAQISSDMSSADVIKILNLLKLEFKNQPETKAIQALIDSVNQSNSNGLLGSTGSSCMIPCLFKERNPNKCFKKCS
ncbi:hypothetical protein EBR77_03480 [bacterium]|nr:hypothetical protein [bacterium]NBX78638.1 hypothetical protein [bacterium]